MLFRRAALVCILVLGLSGCSVTRTAPSATPPLSAQASSGGAPTSDIAAVRPEAATKVLAFIEENHSLSQMKSEIANTFSLGRQFGYATNYTAIGHPSLPNYIAIAGGQTYGISDDHPPSDNGVRGTSVFGQAVAAGKTAAVYVDGMTQNCATSNSGSE